MTASTAFFEYIAAAVREWQAFLYALLFSLL